MFENRTWKGYMAKKAKIKIKLKDFVAKIKLVFKDLDKWWAKESSREDLDDIFTDDVKKLPIFSTVPLIDSKVVMGASHIFEKHLNEKLDANDVRKGGYDSLDELKEDLSKKMKERLFGK